MDPRTQLVDVIRNVRNRWQVTLLAISGIALVVAVFTVLMSMSEGFATALRTTGRSDNAMIVQRGSASELTSWIPLDQRQMCIRDRPWWWRCSRC